MGALAKPGEVFALRGDLGAGKTQFVKGLAAGLGGDGEAVTSPTFTLIHEYGGGRLRLIHFDFYRLESEAEALRLGLDDYLDGTGVLAIEWADKYPTILPAETRWLDFRIGPGDVREIAEGAAP
jgi:tRNA threonylcarbamoyladenosine biosynthesis protein TsaE